MGTVRGCRDERAATARKAAAVAAALVGAGARRPRHLDGAGADRHGAIILLPRPARHGGSALVHPSGWRLRLVCLGALDAVHRLDRPSLSSRMAGLAPRRSSRRRQCLLGAAGPLRDRAHHRDHAGGPAPTREILHRAVIDPPDRQVRLLRADVLADPGYHARTDLLPEVPRAGAASIAAGDGAGADTTANAADAAQSAL